jgi:hypothetical protein
MSGRQWCLGAVVLSAGLLGAACDVKVGENGGLSVDLSAGRASDEWVRTYEIKAGGSLEITNINGQIHASPASGSQVEVRAVREVRSRSEEVSRERLRTVEMREEVSPDRVSIEGPPAEEGQEPGFARPQLTIRYDLRIPAGLNVQLRTQNGGVRLENIQGAQITASTTNGGITGRGVSGAIDASSVNGGIQMDVAALTGDTKMLTVNGGITLNIAPGVNADLDATVVNGRVRVLEGLEFSKTAESRQHVSGRIGTGGHRLVVHTTNGGVRVGTRGAPESSGTN